MFDDASTGEVVSVIADSYREESTLVARRLAAVAELLGRRTHEAEAEDPDCGYMIVTGLQRTSAEVAAAMSLSPAAASVLVSHAEALDSRLPKVAAVLARGDIDWRTVQIILSRTELVSDYTVIAALDSQLSERISRWQSWSRQRVINAVDAAVRTLDRDAVRERERAEDRRRLDVTALGDGTAKVDGVVAAEASVIFDRKISELATAVCAADPRTIDQRRADALAALAQGRPLACRCDSCTARTVSPGAGGGEVKVVVNVIADASTVLGGGDQPGFLEGFGIIDADQVRELAQQATVRPLGEPVVSAQEALRYQPSAAVERFVRMRDMTCRFPGCDRPAQRCDVDHTVPFNHLDPGAGGKTVPGNLKCVCRQHHRLKTFVESWTEVQRPDGSVVWTSPTGATYVTQPGMADLFAPEGPACVAPKARRRNVIRERRTRQERRRGRNRTLRPVNEARRTLQRARRREIEDRKDRNRHRTMLLLFKGGQPSSSPFMRWVNEPYESEVLPPDWRPPPQPPPLPDDPPF